MSILTFIPNSDNKSLIMQHNTYIVNTAKGISSTTVNGNKIFFPFQKLNGDFWTAMGEDRSAALLKGAITRHYKPKKNQKSASEILLKYFQYDSIADFTEKENLEKVEACTLIVLEKQNLYEFIWDGEVKYLSRLDTNRPYIWLSTELYDNNLYKNIKINFLNWLEENKFNLDKQTLMDYHLDFGQDLLDIIVLKNNLHLDTTNIFSITMNKRSRSISNYEVLTRNTVQKRLLHGAKISKLKKQ